ncbi:unnamed protein product, partial [Trichogramma brassicae]
RIRFASFYSRGSYVATGISRSSLGSTSDKERYISFVKFMEDQRLSFRFIDSFKFMSSSLDNLSQKLEAATYSKKSFLARITTAAQIDLLTKKRVFPYEYISHRSEAPRDRTTTARTSFYSSLTDSDISTKDYERTPKQVWDSFLKFSNLGEYSDLYLKTDVLLLVRGI